MTSQYLNNPEGNAQDHNCWLRLSNRREKRHLPTDTCNRADRTMHRSEENPDPELSYDQGGPHVRYRGEAPLSGRRAEKARKTYPATTVGFALASDHARSTFGVVSGLPHEVQADVDASVETALQDAEASAHIHRFIRRCRLPLDARF